MRRHRMIYTALATFAALAVIVSGVAYAASVFTQTINASVNIVGVAGLSFYSNSSATSPISSLSFGDIAQGASGSATFYVKNTGTVAQTLSAGVPASTLPSSVGTVSMTFDGVATKSLAVNAVSAAVVTVQAAPGATLGSASFTVSVNGTSGSGTTTTTATSTTTTTTSTTTTSTVTPVSYSATIQPMLAAGCSCHVAGTQSPRLNTYSAVYSQRNNLPGMGASYLTSSQENTLALWISQGSLNN